MSKSAVVRYQTRPDAAYPPRASIIIPTYNRAALVRKMLHQLTRQSVPASDFEVIVTDDGSSDDTRAAVASFADRLRLTYHFQEDRGNRVTTARNVAARLAAAPILIFLDAGAIPGTDIVRQHLLAHTRAAHRVVAGYAYGYHPEKPAFPGLPAMIEQSDPAELVARYGDDPAFLDMRHRVFTGEQRLTLPWTLFFTLNFSVWTVDYRRVGGFEEDFIHWGADDVEFGFRLDRHGLPFHFNRETWVVEWPHERDWEDLGHQVSKNMDLFLAKFPEPVVELGRWLVTHGEFPRWDRHYQELTEYIRTVRDRDVADEIAEAAARIPRADRVAIIGAGGRIPDSVPRAVLVDFDQELLSRALRAGRRAGHHAIGLRTPLPERSVDSVIITSRLAGLWPRWHHDLRAEAYRIGDRVHIPAFGRVAAAERAGSVE